MTTSDRRVVLSGLGPITAAGVGIESLWQAACEGASAISRIERFDATGFRSRHAGTLPADAFKVRDSVPKSYRKATKVMARDIELAVGAAAAAIADAGLLTKPDEPVDGPTIPSNRMGCHIGAGLIAADVDELTLALTKSVDAEGRFDYGLWGTQGMGHLTPLWLLKYLPNMLACHVTIIHDCQGPSNTITCAESSATLSIGESMRAIQRGGADACLSGGCDSKVNPMALLRQQFAGRIAKTTDDDSALKAIRPYAEDADGTLVGEGGGILVVEALDSVRKRGGRIYAEISGFGAAQSSCPDTVGARFADDDPGVAHAIASALRNAGLAPEDIDAIVPFGSGIRVMDDADRRAMKTVFGDRLPTIPLMLPIPFFGCCGAGTGAIAIALAAKAIESQRLPARVNDGVTEGLDAAATPSRDADLDAVLVFTTSLGGQTAAVVLTRVGEDDS
ncbi:MAG: beta-ketoacyl synthase N-terminal-like domain-containing protein [Planctomycetota bacterium]|nr:beta-ketoacyl synthase N-terminal-like domain-containing protein [Planctomycetota bacterium]